MMDKFTSISQVELNKTVAESNCSTPRLDRAPTVLIKPLFDSVANSFPTI